LRTFAKAEELGLEAEDVYTKTLGKNHEETNKARVNLALIRREMSRKRGERM
jgi:hypothetical protein